MKAALSVLVFFVLTSLADAAGEAPASAVVPQPRVRLQRMPAGIAVRVEPATTNPPEAPAVLEKLVVTDTKLPAPPRPFSPEDRTNFSLTKGGPLLKKQLGPAILELGLWPWTDLFAEDSRFKPASTRAEFEFARLKW